MSFENSWNTGQIPSIATLSTNNSFTELLLYIKCTSGHLALNIFLKMQTAKSEYSGQTIRYDDNDDDENDND